tara:strand:- start:198 stop:425 length:228 start_codon:yes stop_codon:yes gene_type:complete
MNKIIAPFAFAFLLILGFVILALLLALPTQWLWNECLVAAINPVNPIGFWQAFGLNVLFSIMFNNNAINHKKKSK